MNIYKIIFSHHAPKDGERGIKALLLAKNDEQVYEWIASEPETEEGSLYNSWKDKEKITYDKDREVFIEGEFDSDESWYDAEGEPELFKDRMLRLKGEINDDDYDFSDAYYGITLLGWELLKEGTKKDYSELIDLGIVFKV